MTEAAPSVATLSPAEPDGAPRLPVLDILRGIAILAILFMNINGMGGSLHAFFGDVRHYGWSGADQVTWWVREVLANGTARALLEMLFGAGMVILTDRAASRMGRWAVFRHYAWRNLVLFALGLVHVFVLLWPGDILHTYGLAAIVAVLFRGFRPRWLIVFGLLLSTLMLVGGGLGITFQQMQERRAVELRVVRDAGRPLTDADRTALAEAEKRDAERATRKAKEAALVAAEDKARTGTAATWVQAAWDMFFYIQAMFLEILFVWEAASTMLIGAALYKLGILQGARSRRYYIGLTAISYAVGLSLRAWFAWEVTRFDGSVGVVGASSELARLATTLGHVGLINLVLMSAGGLKLLKPFEAAGKTALTVYILQTLICVFILYPPWGLGLYGQMSWATYMATALVINAALLVWANWWVKHYRIAPVEWAWRSVVEGRRLPFRGTSGAGVSVPGGVAAAG